jgi:hypothetical protein
MCYLHYAEVAKTRLEVMEMRRRDFVLGTGTVAAWSIGPGAQQTAVPVSGVGTARSYGASNSMADALVAQLKRNAAACATAITPPGNDPLYYMTGRAAAEIERLQDENSRLRVALAEIGQLAAEEGADHFTRRVAKALE